MTWLWCVSKSSFVDGLEMLEPWTPARWSSSHWVSGSEVITQTLGLSCWKPSSINAWSSSVYLQEVLYLTLYLSFRVILFPARTRNSGSGVDAAFSVRWEKQLGRCLWYSCRKETGSCTPTFAGRTNEVRLWKYCLSADNLFLRIFIIFATVGCLLSELILIKHPHSTMNNPGLAQIID